MTSIRKAWMEDTGFAIRYDHCHLREPCHIGRPNTDSLEITDRSAPAPLAAQDERVMMGGPSGFLGNLIRWPRRPPRHLTLPHGTEDLTYMIKGWGECSDACLPCKTVSKSGGPAVN